MKKSMKAILGLAMVFVMLFAIAACGGSQASSSSAVPETPADKAVAALDKNLAALKTADATAIQEVSGGEDIFGDAEATFGSKEGVESILKSMFGHFDYKIGEAEQVDDSNVNVTVTVSNADMSKAVTSWFSNLMNYAMQNPDIANDEAALQAKTIEMLQEAVDETAKADGGIVSSEVVFPMELVDGEWVISDKIDDSVLDAVLGGFMTAINNLYSGS